MPHKYPTSYLLHPYTLLSNHNFWEELDNDQYDELFEGSAMRRAKFEKYKDNVAAVAGNMKSKE